jgi:putative tryptophan/tyrosine transport system substrate-binding protein
MRRRELLLALATGMMSARAVRAQQKTMPVIGFLSGASGPGPEDGFGQGLAEGGYVLGRNLDIEYRWARASLIASRL